jgi:signal peptidase I
MFASRDEPGRLRFGGLPVSRARVLGLVGSLGLILSWWVFFAPSALLGRTTYAMVVGTSMEPILHTGDLAIARVADGYEHGDLVVFRVDSGSQRGLVIHRIVSGDAAHGWKTQGDNRHESDPWVVPDRAIAGKYWFDIAAFGGYLVWGNQHWVAFAGVLGGVALLSYAPLRRRRVTAVLREALERATVEPRREGRTAGEYATLAVSGAASLTSLGVVGLLAASHQLGSIRGIVGLTALAWSGGLVLYLVQRLYDGRGLPEPQRSLYALSGRLRLLAELPAVDDDVQDVPSPLALRSIAESRRLPILHRVDPDSDRHEFLVLTADHGAFRWAASRSSPGAALRG